MEFVSNKKHLMMFENPECQSEIEKTWFKVPIKIMTSILNVFSILSHSREKVSPMSSFLIQEEKDLL